MNRKRLQVGCFTIALFVLGCLFALFAYPFIDLFFHGQGVRRVEARLLEPDVFEPVARTLALHCQSDETLVPRRIDYAWLPSELNEIALGSGTITPDGASVSMGGSHYDFGYRLEIDTDSSDQETNVWKLYSYSDRLRVDQYLCMVRLAKSQAASRLDLKQQVARRYDAELAKNAANPYPNEKKIWLYFHFEDRASAREACREMLERMPDYWWAILINALVESADSPELGERLIVDWVEKEKGYFRYLDLAYYYECTGQPKESATAMTRATAYDLKDRDGHPTNAVHRGFSAAMYAFQSGEYHAAKVVTEKLIAASADDAYGKQALTDLKARCSDAMHNPSVGFAWPKEMKPFDPFSDTGIDPDKLVRCASPTPLLQPEGAMNGDNHFGKAEANECS